MQTCSSQQTSPVVLEKEGILVPLHYCSLPLLAKTLVALFTHAEWQKAPWDLGANVYTGACNSHPAQGGQKKAAAPSTFSILTPPVCEGGVAG